MHTKEMVLTKLATIVDTRKFPLLPNYDHCFRGSINSNTFSITRHIPGTRNRGRPVISGVLVEQSDGTEIELSFELDEHDWGFTAIAIGIFIMGFILLVHGMLTTGNDAIELLLVSLLGVISIIYFTNLSFYNEVNEARKILVKLFLSP